MATSMDYDSPYKVDSPFNYDVEEGALSPGSGRSSPGTIRDNASDCGTQTDDKMGNTDETVTTMRVHLDNTPENTQTPQVIARKIGNKFHQSKQTEDRRNLQSFNNNRTTTTSEQSTSTNLHSYEHNRPVNNQNRSTTKSYISPPLPNYPPPVRPPPPSDYVIENPRTQTHVQQRLFTKTANNRPNNLRFPYAVTPRSNNKKSFFHQSTKITIHYCHIEIGLTCHLIRESIISSCHLSTILKTVCQSTSRLCHQKIRTQLNVLQKIWGETSSTRHCILNLNNSTA